MTTRILRSVLVVPLLLLGCSAPTLSTLEEEVYDKGVITVERPEVWSRARILPYTTRETSWLLQKLEEDIEPGVQGLRDVRLLTRFAAAFEGRVGVRALELEEGEAELNELRREMQKKELQLLQERLEHQLYLERLTRQTVPQEGEEPPPSNWEPGGVERDPTDIRGKGGSDPRNMQGIRTGDKAPIDTSDTIGSAAQLTGLEKLHDQLAYRDAVNATLRETAFDDLADLFGYTVYLCKFDIGVLPGDATREGYLAELTLHPFPGPIDPTRIQEMLARAINRRASVEVVSLSRRVQEGNVSHGEILAMQAYLSLRGRELVMAARSRDGGDESESEDEGADLPHVMGNPSAELAGDLKFSYDRSAERWSGVLAKATLEERTSLNALELAELRHFVFLRYREAFGDYVTLQETEGFGGDGAEWYGFHAIADGKPRQLDNIRRFFREHKEQLTVYTYALSPKEYAQNISDVMAKENVTQLMASLSALYGGAADASAAADYMNRSQTRLQAILRNPLVLAFGKGGQTFGWLLGPRFRIDDEEVAFEFARTNYSVTALIAVPAYVNKLDVTVQSNWVRIADDSWWFRGPRRMWNLDDQLAMAEQAEALNPKDGSLRAHRAEEVASILPLRRMEMRLPFDPDAVFELFGSSEQGIRNRPPRIRSVTPDVLRPRDEVVLAVSGIDLWKEPQVLIGGKRAKRVEALPDLKGLLVTIDVPDEPGRTLPLTVATAYGIDTLRDGVRILEEEAPPEEPAPGEANDDRPDGR